MYFFFYIALVKCRIASFLFLPTVLSRWTMEILHKEYITSTQSYCICSSNIAIKEYLMSAVIFILQKLPKHLLSKTVLGFRVW